MPNEPDYEAGLQAHIKDFLESSFGGRTPEVVAVEIVQAESPDAIVSARSIADKSAVITVSFGDSASTRGTDYSEADDFQPRRSAEVAQFVIGVYAFDSWEHARSLANDVRIGLSNDTVYVPSRAAARASMLIRFVSKSRIPTEERSPRVINAYEIIFEAKVFIGESVFDLPEADRLSLGIVTGPTPDEPITSFGIDFGADDGTIETITERTNG